MSKAVHLRITGVVQGVGFRYWTMRAALSRGLRGWVRNRYDGSVEALVVGDDDAVDAMIADCRNGPSGSVVDDVEVTPTTDDGSHGFRQLSTE